MLININIKIKMTKKLEEKKLLNIKMEWSNAVFWFKINTTYTQKIKSTSVLWNVDDEKVTLHIKIYLPTIRHAHNCLIFFNKKIIIQIFHLSNKNQHISLCLNYSVVFFLIILWCPLWCWLSSTTSTFPFPILFYLL